MGSAIEIERAVEQLPPQELARFRAWFTKFDAQQWDVQFEQDVALGALDALADEAIAEHRQDRSTERRDRRVK
jgi:hypothetical protein